MKFSVMSVAVGLIACVVGVGSGFAKQSNVPPPPAPAPLFEESSSYVNSEDGGGDICKLSARITQDPYRIMNAFGWFSNCSSPVIYSWLSACVVGQSGAELSCTSFRSQFGSPPHYSYHAGWTCTPGINYRGRVYGAFAVPYPPSGSLLYRVTTNPITCL
jgi:hypothetical protein